MTRIAEPLAGRKHGTGLSCWCNPMISAVCEFCDPEGLEACGIPCSHCQGRHLIGLSGEPLNEIRHMFVVHGFGYPSLVVLHFHREEGPTSRVIITPCLIPGMYGPDDEADDDDETDGADVDVGESPAPWEGDGDAWKRKKT